MSIPRTRHVSNPVSTLVVFAVYLPHGTQAFDQELLKGQHVFKVGSPQNIWKLMKVSVWEDGIGTQNCIEHWPTELRSHESYVIFTLPNMEWNCYATAYLHLVYKVQPPVYKCSVHCGRHHPTNLQSLNGTHRGLDSVCCMPSLFLRISLHKITYSQTCLCRSWQAQGFPKRLMIAHLWQL